MKKTILLLTALSLSFFLCACSQSQSVNLLSFTDRLNKANPEDTVSLSDYYIRSDTFSLIFTSGSDVLLTLNENAESKISFFRLSIGKVDKNGKAVEISDSAASFFRKKAEDCTAAFTAFETETVSELLSELVPVEGKDFAVTGEVTAERDNFLFVYYSNGICSSLTVTNTFLEEIESTQKPESKPYYAETANLIE